MSARGLLKTAKSTDAFAKPCQILVLSEDVMTYGRAMYVCQRILSQFSFEVNFNFRCWDFNHQNDADMLQKTVEAATQADIILLSLNGTQLNGSLQQWLQAFSETRSDTDGAFVLILGTQAGPPAAIQDLADRIHAVADQVRMDFIPLMPTARVEIQLPARPVWPNALEPQPGNERHHYDHWGLNE
jgi:hypothetical protein